VIDYQKIIPLVKNHTINSEHNIIGQSVKMTSILCWSLECIYTSVLTNAFMQYRNTSFLLSPIMTRSHNAKPVNYVTMGNSTNLAWRSHQTVSGKCLHSSRTFHCEAVMYILLLACQQIINWTIISISQLIILYNTKMTQLHTVIHLQQI
jgi:hypothetical protein